MDGRVARSRYVGEPIYRHRGQPTAGEVLCERTPSDQQSFRENCKDANRSRDARPRTGSGTSQKNELGRDPGVRVRLFMQRLRPRRGAWQCPLTAPASNPQLVHR
jgi:hypothetical protein